MSDHIEILRGPNCWLARLPAPAQTIPLPFTVKAPAHEVKAALQKLHPNARIVFLEEVFVR